ncbi:MAG: response regulator [Gemmatimonadaceae bacterium]|nr:response regulator [Gemmatimonadaceae bacterium]
MTAESSCHVIMADDEPHIGRIVQMKLEQGPFVVTLTYDGEEALDVVQAAERVDLLLLDLMMPRKTGLEVLRVLREQERFKSLPIVILTAGGNAQDLRAAMQLGATEVLTKPFSPKKLYALVARLTNVATDESGAVAE